MPTYNNPYPTPEFNGPKWAFFHEPQPDYPVLVGQKYKDKGTDRWKQADNVARTFVFEYDSLTLVEAQILDEHNDSTFNNAFGFDFLHPRTGILYVNCHYDKYERPKHEKYNIQKRIATLIYEP